MTMEIYKLIAIYTYIVFPITSLLTSSTLTYLFYYQASKVAKTTKKDLYKTRDLNKLIRNTTRLASGNLEEDNDDDILYYKDENKSTAGQVKEGRIHSINA